MDPAALHRILATSELRQFEPIVKAVFMIDQKYLSFREASSFFGISSSALFRAVQAYHEGRVVGLSGQPRIFALAEEVSFIEMVKDELHLKKRLTYEGLANMVRI